MNRLLIFAALLAILTAVVHIFAGGADTVVPLLTSALTVEAKLTLYAVWHMASSVLVLSAVALFVGSLPRHRYAARYLVLFVSIMWFVFGIIFLSIAASQPETAWFIKLPQWILLLPVGILGLWGVFRSKNVMP